MLSSCLAIGLLLAVPGTAWGISGYASGQTAAGAQYPDSTVAKSGAKAVISTLAELMRAIRNSQLHDPAQWQAARPALVHRELGALKSGAGASLDQKGSIALLIAAGAVALVGGVLRWQRGVVPPS